MTQYDLQQAQKRQQELQLQESERSVAAANQNSAIARMVNIIYFLFSLLEMLLAVRLVLHLLGANPANPFANFIYVLSAPFIALFAGLVQNVALSQTAVLEITTIIAMFVYTIVAWLFGQLIWLVLSRPR